MFRFVRNLDRKVIFVVGFVSSFLLFATIILVQLADRDHEIARQKDTGLGATAGVDWSNPYSLWAHPRLVDAVFPLHRSARMYQAGVTLDPLQAPSSRRKIVRTGALWLAVNDPIHTIDEIAALAQRYNGYVVTEQNQTLAVTGEEGTLTLRVSADRFDEARSRIKALAIRVDQEQTTANDVTKDYCDFEARLRTLRAEEEQYFQILKSAHKVEDTLAVTEKMSEVRGKIEQAQGDFNFLQKTVETSLIEVHLQSAPGGRFAGLDWHPLMRAKLELRDGIEALGEFAGALLAIAVRLPVILLWVLTITGLVAAAWRVGRRLWKWFVPARQSPA